AGVVTANALGAVPRAAVSRVAVARNLRELAGAVEARVVAGRLVHVHTVVGAVHDAASAVDGGLVGRQRILVRRRHLGRQDVDRLVVDAVVDVEVVTGARGARVVNDAAGIRGIRAVDERREARDADVLVAVRAAVTDRNRGTEDLADERAAQAAIHRRVDL